MMERSGKLKHISGACLENNKRLDMNSDDCHRSPETDYQILTRFMLINMRFDAFNCGMAVKLAIISDTGDFYHS